MEKRPKRHRHESSMWIFARRNGEDKAAIFWCYQCGAVKSYPADKRWTKTVGVGGKNPAS